MKTFLVEEVYVVEEGDTVFPNLKHEVVRSSHTEHVFCSGAIDGLERAEEWADFRVRVTMKEDRTRQEIRICEYEFDDVSGEFISRRILKQWYLPLTMEEIVANYETLEAVLIDNQWFYVTGSYISDDETNDGEPVLVLGYYDDGYMNERDVNASELIGRTDVKLITGCSVKVGK